MECKIGQEKQERDRRLIYLGVFLLTAVGCYAVLHYVVPMGDDLFYGRWGRLSPGGLLEAMVQHYYTANGRNLVHVLDALLLSSDARVAALRVIIALLLGTIALNLTRLAAGSRRQTLAAATLCACGLFLLPAVLTRQSVYWFTGAMNYVLPLALLLAYWVLLRGTLSGRRGWGLTSVFALLAGLTVEQISMMAFGLTLLSIGESCLICKKAFDKRALWPLFLSAAGTASILLAPAVSYRAAMTVSPVEGGTLALVKYNLLALRHSFLFGETLFPIHLLALTVIPLWLAVRAVRRRSMLDGVFAVLSASVFAAWYWLPDNVPEIVSSSPAVPRYVAAYALAVLGGYLACALYAAIRAAMDHDRIPLFALILGVGSQVMMLVSPTVGPRTMLCCAGMLLLFTAHLLHAAPFFYLLGAGGVLGWYGGQAWVAAVAAIAVVLWLLRRHRSTRMVCAAVCCIPLLFCAWTTLKDQHDGYQANAAVDADNRAAIAAYDGADALTLRRFADDLYAWVMPYHNDYYDVYYKLYYGLPRETALYWQ
nr:DUF6056 family protein [uncultured Agathobaculum sp.]